MTTATDRRERHRTHSLVRERLIEAALIWTMVGTGYLLGYGSIARVWNPQLVAFGFFAAGGATAWMAVAPSRTALAWGAALTNVAIAGRVASILYGSLLQGGWTTLALTATQGGLTLAGGYGIWRWWTRDVREWSEGGPTGCRRR